MLIYFQSYITEYKKMITKTSINKVVISNILKAIREAQEKEKAYVYNTKEQPFIVVRKCKVDSQVLFQIEDPKTNASIKNLVLDAVIRLMTSAQITSYVCLFFINKLTCRTSMPL